MGLPAKLYGPLAAAAAAVATVVASTEIPRSSSSDQLPPYILYTAHPSLPIPPVASCSSVGCTLPSKRQRQQRQQEQVWFQGSRSPSVEQVVQAVSSFVSDSILKVHSSHPQLLSNAPQILTSSPAPATSYEMLQSSQQHAAPFMSSVPSTSVSFMRQAASSVSPAFVSEYIGSWYERSLNSRENSQVDASASRGKDSSVTVVLLGWLGAKQKHLKRYADWYNERGINAVTFVIPMRDVIGGRGAEKQIEHLAAHLAAWMGDDEDGKEKHLFFHTFSNTGWLSYGVILERLLQRNGKLLDGIKGCIVDSAPVAQPDPQVWASGFSAALLQKKSCAARRLEAANDPGNVSRDAKPDVAEQALRTMLERFFSCFLQLPVVKRRLSEVVTVLSEHQPRCPQLYFYSDADKVIPAKSVESFMEEQRKAGRIVKACNLLQSPHVDHFRNFPDVYSSHLGAFIHDCLSRWSFDSSA